MKIISLNLTKKHNSIFGLFFVMCLLLVVGLVFVYSASFYSAEISYGNKFFFLKKQLIGIAVGFLFLIIFTFFDYHKLAKIKYVFITISIVFLCLVFVPGIGVTNYGATRWINFKFITFQPSEFAKFSFIIFAADYLSKHNENIKSIKGIFPVIFVGCVFCFLIIMEPNMSITICMATLMVVMLFVGGVSLKQFVILALPAVALIVVLIVVEPYRLRRLVAFVDPFASSSGEGFQLVQSILGISLGGAFGSGIFKSRQKYLFLPFSESDFIFSIIAEETGFVGCFVLITLYLILILLILKIAKRARDSLGCLIASGIASLFAIQVLLNIAVVTGLVPPTGLPLPFISAGSTSIMVFMSMLGVVQNVAWQSNNKFVKE